VWRDAVCQRANLDGTHVKASCAPAMHSWTRRDPPRPPGAPSGLSMSASRSACRASPCHPPVGAVCFGPTQVNLLSGAY
jgi:hypothetical protein